MEASIGLRLRLEGCIEDLSSMRTPSASCIAARQRVKSLVEAEGNCDA